MRLTLAKALDVDVADLFAKCERESH